MLHHQQSAVPRRPVAFPCIGGGRDSFVVVEIQSCRLLAVWSEPAAERLGMKAMLCCSTAVVQCPR